LDIHHNREKKVYRCNHADFKEVANSVIIYSTSFDPKLPSFVLHRRYRVIKVCNDMRVSKWWQFSFLGEIFL